VRPETTVSVTSAGMVGTSYGRESCDARSSLEASVGRSAGAALAEAADSLRGVAEQARISKERRRLVSRMMGLP
jgi:hypothetical protein